MIDILFTVTCILFASSVIICQQIYFLKSDVQRFEKEILIIKYSRLKDK